MPLSDPFFLSARGHIDAIVEAGDGQLLMVGEFGIKVIGKGNLRR